MSWLPRFLLAIGGALLVVVGAAGSPVSADEIVRATISDADRKTFATVTGYPVADPYVQMRPRDGTINQQWDLTMRQTGIWTVRSIGLRMCLTGHPSGPVGAPVTVEPCRNSTSLAQLWRIPRFSPDGTVTFTNIATGLCLTQPPPTTYDRRLRERRCDAGPLQRFRINRPAVL